MISRQLRLLLLTTQRPETIKAEWPFYQNWTLPQRLSELGAAVSQLCWRDPSVTTAQLTQFDRVCFLWCNNYHEHGVAFQQFLTEKLHPAQIQAGGPRKLQILNPVDFVLWNMDKAVYLPELAAHGFLLPTTATVDLSALTTGTTDELARAICAACRSAGVGGGKVVLKPAISGSSKLTHLVHDVEKLSSMPAEADLEFLSLLLDSGLEGALIVQAFEPAIADGEYSLVFVASEHTHTMLKTPAWGQFKCQAEFGGGIAELAAGQTPQEAVTAARDIMGWLGRRFHLESVPYCRIDGVVRDGRFVLMEVEAIEPHLWLETCADQSVRERLYAVLLN